MTEPMTDPMTAPVDVSVAIARTVRGLRVAMGWSLQTLADHAGAGEEDVAALEQGDASPSLETLIQVSDALGVPLARLVELEPDPLVRIVTPADQPVLWRGPSGGTGTFVAGSEPRPYLEVWTWRLEPGEDHGGPPHPAGNREIAWVEEGTLTLVIDGRRYEIGAGGAAVFVGDRPHSYLNEGDVPLRYTIALADV
jgi:transcriptional regulator with XRE-family HTH domain